MKPFASTALKVEHNALWVLDQTRLPQSEVWLESNSPESMIQIIKDLRVRGAPLIGVAAALQLAHFIRVGANDDEFQRALAALRAARPTAVNLMNALDRMLHVWKDSGLEAAALEAEKICAEDVALCARMAANGAALLQDGDQLLTHCNTGGLATVGLGTALGCVIEASRAGKSLHVYVDETRPLLQGGRLTTWELTRARIPFTLICDNMAASLMQKGEVDRVLVGADRIARNGDFANKIGTYSLAVNCKFHGIPFYVVAPQTTVDQQCHTGREIPIEERAPEEVRREWAPAHAPVWNPAFDITPESLVSAWILDRGVFTREDVRNGALLP